MVTKDPSRAHGGLFDNRRRYQHKPRSIRSQNSDLPGIMRRQVSSNILIERTALDSNWLCQFHFCLVILKLRFWILLKLVIFYMMNLKITSVIEPVLLSWNLSQPLLSHNWYRLYTLILWFFANNLNLVSSTGSWTLGGLINANKTVWPGIESTKILNSRVSSR